MSKLWTQRGALLCASLLLFGLTVRAQHQGHQMPSSSPSPSPTPAKSTDQKQQMPGMVMPSPTPASSPAAGEMPGMPGHKMANAADTKESSSGGMMEMGPLLLMRGDEMFVRVGESKVNVMPMGR